MNDNTLAKFGGTFSILIGVLFFIWGVTEFSVLSIPENAYFDTLAQGNIVWMVHWLTWLLIGVTGLGAVPAIAELVKPVHSGWVRWTSNLAYFSFALFALWGLGALTGEVQFASSVVAGQEAAQSALALVPWVGWTGIWGWLDGGFLVRAGGIVIWLLATNILALRGNTMPSILAYIGIVLATVWILGIAAFGFGVITVGLPFVVGTLILAPIWFIWTGLRLRGTES